MKNKYEAYRDDEINTLLNEPWEISDRPYMLHAAFALSCLYDAIAQDDEDNMTPDIMWGATIPKKILDHLIVDIATDFNDAADNRKQIKIWERSYSIRKVNAYDRARLGQIFNFPIVNDEYAIDKYGVLNLCGRPSDLIAEYETTKEQSLANRTYLRQIIMMAEDDRGNGWNKLTDMEVLMYCWAVFYNKHQCENWIQFKTEYKDYFYVSEKEVFNCLTNKAVLRQRPISMYTFSKEKVDEWNKSHNQLSKAADIPPQTAEDFWYDVALKHTFKPIDLR